MHSIIKCKEQSLVTINSSSGKPFFPIDGTKLNIEQLVGICGYLNIANLLKMCNDGLGDRVNVIGSIIPQEHGVINVLVDYEELVGTIGERDSQIVMDLLLCRPGIIINRGGKVGKNFHFDYVKSDVKPEIDTEIFFRENELRDITELLNSIGIEYSTLGEYICICPNTPREGFGSKLMSCNEWIEFISSFKGNYKGKIIILPTFDDGNYDLKVEYAFRGNGNYVINLQTLLVRNKDTLNRVIGMQVDFGLNRNNNGLSFRQNAALYKVLIRSDLQGFFHDSAPVHIAAAATKKVVVSGICPIPNEYKPHNGGKYWRKIEYSINKEIFSIIKENGKYS